MDDNEKARVCAKSVEKGKYNLCLETQDGDVLLTVPVATWEGAKVDGYVTLPGADWEHPEAGIRLQLEF